MYESSRIYNKALKGTPMEQSQDELPGYDQYQKERRGPAAEEKKDAATGEPPSK